MTRYTLSSDDVAAAYSVARKTVIAWATRKLDPMPGRKILARWHFNGAEVELWIARQSERATP